MRTILLATVLAGMAACAPLQDKLHPGETATLQNAWMTPTVQQAPAPLYCYRTIGREDCYRTPPAGERTRLPGHYGPPPEVLAY